MPRDTDTPQAPRDGAMDRMGAVLLSAGLVAVLLVTSDTDLWTTHPVVTALVLTTGIAVLAAWVAVERRVRRPLVDVRALRHHTGESK